jgi:hypothetical protein
MSTYQVKLCDIINGDYTQARKIGPDKTTIIMSEMAWQSWTFSFLAMRLFFFVSLFFALFFVFLAWDWEIVAR